MADPVSRAIERRLAAIREVEDPADRAAQSAALLSALETGQELAREVRDGAVILLLSSGRRQSEVARIIGTTRGFMAHYRGKYEEPVSA
jgi:hypothetical protein